MSGKSTLVLYFLQKIIKQDLKKQKFHQRHGISPADNRRLLIFQGLKKEHEKDIYPIYFAPKNCPYTAILEDKNTVLGANVPTYPPQQTYNVYM